MKVLKLVQVVKWSNRFLIPGTPLPLGNNDDKTTWIYSAKEKQVLLQHLEVVGGVPEDGFPPISTPRLKLYLHHGSNVLFV